MDPLVWKTTWPRFMPAILTQTVLAPKPHALTVTKLKGLRVLLTNKGAIQVLHLCIFARRHAWVCNLGWQAHGISRWMILQLSVAAASYQSADKVQAGHCSGICKHHVAP
jgi:hypothetical protein